MIPIVVPFFSGAASEAAAAGCSFWSVASGCLMLNCSLSSAMFGLTNFFFAYNDNIKC